MKTFFRFAGLFLLLAFRANSQVADTAAYAPGLAYALARYDSATTESQHLYNGPQYFIYDAQAPEHPFYASREWTTGSVFYDGQLFSQVPIQYDIVKDQVVVRYVQSQGNVLLQNEKVRYFTLVLNGTLHYFVRMDASAGPGLRAGFYELLYEGKSSVLARRVKERLEQVGLNSVLVGFPRKDLYYLYHNGTYRPVHSRKSVLALMEDQKKPMKKYLRENTLSFRDNREAAITALATYYDQLTHP